LTRPTPDAEPIRTPLLPLALTFALIAVPSLAFVDDLGSAPPQHWDAYLAIDRSLGFLRTGDWLSIDYHFEPHFQKPPMQYMLTAGLIHFGVEPYLALRFWPYLFAVGSLIATAVMTALCAGNRGWGVPAAVGLLVASPIFWVHARIGLLDSGQLFFLLLSFCCALAAERNPRWWIATGIAVGLGFLQKTPVALLAIGFWLWLRNRSGADPNLRWATLRHNAHFRSGRRIAIALCVVWPAIQIVRHGAAFIDGFFLDQMVVRFSPIEFEGAGPTGGPFRWLAWIAGDVPQIWLPALAMIPFVYGLARLRDVPNLRALASYVVACAAVLTLGRGEMYPRYILLLLPHLAVIASLVMLALLPRPWMAAAVSGLLLASAAPNLRHVPAFSHRYDRSQIIEVSRRFRELLQANESPVIVHRGTQSDVPPPAFQHHAALNRPVLRIGLDELDRFGPKARKRGFSAPFLGVSAAPDVAAIRRALGNIEEVEIVRGHSIWRLRTLADASPSPTPH